MFNILVFCDRHPKRMASEVFLDALCFLLQFCVHNEQKMKIRMECFSISLFKCHGSYLTAQLWLDSMLVGKSGNICNFLLSYERPNVTVL